MPVFKWAMLLISFAPIKLSSAGPGDPIPKASSQKVSPLLKLPPLATDADKLRFLLAIKEQVPKLFSDAAKYDVDLFSLLEANQNLLQQLVANPDYIREFAARKNLSEARFLPPKTGASIVLPNTNQDAVLTQWKAALTNAIDWSKDTNFSDAILALSEAAKTRGRLPATSEGALGAFMSILSKDNSPAATQLREKLKSDEFKTGTFEQKIAFIQKNSREIDSHIMVGFDSKRAGFDAGDRPIGTYADLIDSLSQIVELDKLPLPENLQLSAILKEKGIQRIAPKDVPRILSEIEALKWSDFERYHDKQDVLIPTAKAMGLTDGEALTLGSVVKTRQDQILKRNTVTESVALRALRIQEVPPYVGIFRGCASGDCSTQYSFPYPNDPHERVFFIYAENSLEPKGIVSSTIVESGGKKSLYVITLQGNLSSADAITVLHGLEKIKTQIGIEQIIIPSANNGLINNPNIAAVIDREARRGKRAEIHYLNPEIRQVIQEAPKHNSGHYDHMSRNTEGNIFVPRAEISAKMEVTFTAKAIPEIKLPTLTHANTLDFALDMHASKRADVEKRVLALGGHQQADFNRLTTALENEEKLPVDDFMARVMAEARSLYGTSFNESEFKSRDHLFYLGRMASVDALDESHFKESMRLIRADFRSALLDDSNPDIGWNSLKPFKSYLAKDHEWNKLLIEQIIKQLSDGKNIWEGHNFHLMEFLEPSLSSEFYKTHFSEEKVIAFIRSPHSSLYVLAENGSGIIHAQPQILPTFLNEAAARGDILSVAKVLELYPRELEGQIPAKKLGTLIVQGIANHSADAEPGALNNLVNRIYWSQWKLEAIHPQVMPEIVKAASDRGDIQALSSVVDRYLLAGSVPSWLETNLGQVIVGAIQNPKSDLHTIMPEPWKRIFEAYPETRPAYLKEVCSRGSLRDLSVFKNYFLASTKNSAEDKKIMVAAAKAIKTAHLNDQLLNSVEELFKAYPSLIEPYIQLIGQEGTSWDYFDKLFKAHGETIKADTKLSHALKQSVIAKFKMQAGIADPRGVLMFLDTSIASWDLSLLPEFEKNLLEAIKNESTKAENREEKFRRAARELPQYVGMALTKKHLEPYTDILIHGLCTMNPEALLSSFINRPLDFDGLQQAETLAKAINAGTTMQMHRMKNGQLKQLIERWRTGGDIGAIQVFLRTLHDDSPRHINFKDAIDVLADIIVDDQRLLNTVLEGHSRLQTAESLVRLAQIANPDQQKRIAVVLDKIPLTLLNNDLRKLTDNKLLNVAQRLSPIYLDHCIAAAAETGQGPVIHNLIYEGVRSEEQLVAAKRTVFSVMAKAGNIDHLEFGAPPSYILSAAQRDEMMSAYRIAGEQGKLKWIALAASYFPPHLITKNHLEAEFEREARIAIAAAIQAGRIDEKSILGTDLDRNPDALDIVKKYDDVFKEALESTDPKVHENLAAFFKDCGECKAHVENDLFQKPKWKKALVRAAQIGKIDFVNERIKAAGAEIPADIQAMSNQRQARRALTSSGSRAKGSKLSCGELLQLLYLKTK